MTERQPALRRWTWLAVGLILVLLAAVLILWWRPIYGFVADQDRVRAWVADLGPWGPAAIVGLETAQSLLGPIPGTAIEAASGYLFGPWLGALYAMTGIALGSLLGFVLARQFGRPLLTRFVGPRAVARLDDLVERGGALFFFLLWLLPFVPDDLVCLAAGLTPMSTPQFLLLMVVGRTPGILVATWLGTNAAQVSPLWWGLGLGGLVVAALIVWRWGEPIQARVLAVAQNLSDWLRR